MIKCKIIGYNVWFQKISIPPHGWSMEIPRGWGAKR